MLNLTRTTMVADGGSGKKKKKKEEEEETQTEEAEKSGTMPERRLSISDSPAALMERKFGPDPIAREINANMLWKQILNSSEARQKEDKSPCGGFGSGVSENLSGKTGAQTAGDAPALSSAQPKSQTEKVAEILRLESLLSQEKDPNGAAVLQRNMERNLRGLGPDALRAVRDEMLDQADALTEELMHQDVGDAAKTEEIARLKAEAENLDRLIPMAENVARGLPAGYNGWDRAWDRIGRGAGEFNSGVASSADYLANLLPRVEGALTGEAAEGTFTGQLLKPVTDATGAWKDYVQTTTANIDRRVRAADGDSKVQKFISDLTSGVIGALPNAFLAMMTAGGSAAAQLGTQGAGLLDTARGAAMNLVQNPAYWTSAAQTLGPSYDKAIADGATETEAIFASVLSTAFNAAVEVGGVEALPGELRGVDLSTPEKAWKWFRTALDEGKEGVVQGVWERLTNKAVYDHDKPFVSWEDESAVFNPKVSAQEGTMGTAVGMVLGGGQLAVDAMIQTLPAETLRVCLDTAVNGDQSELVAARDMYIRNGLTPEEAGRKVVQDVLKRCEGAFEEDVDSSISAETVQRISAAVEQDRLNCTVAGENVRYNGLEQELLEAALEMPPDSEARNQADLYVEQHQTELLQRLDEAAASSRRGGTVETEAQLQELAQEIGRQELALEQLTEGDSIAGQLTSEQLGRLALAMQEARGEAAQNLLPAERAPTQNEAQEMQKLQLALDWENEAGKLTDGGIDDKVSADCYQSDSMELFQNVLERGHADEQRLRSFPKIFEGKSVADIDAYLNVLGYDTIVRSSVRQNSKAQVIVTNNYNGQMNIAQFQVSPGGGKHGPNPYIKISTTDLGKIKIVFGNPDTYVSKGEKHVIVIFAEGDHYD